MQMSPPRFVDFSLPSSNRDFCFPRSPRLLLPRKPTKIISPFLSFVENSQKSLQVPGGEGRERELSAREARGRRRRRRRQWGSRGCCRSWSQSWRPLARWSCGARRWLLTPIPGSTRALYPAATASARASPPPGPPSAASWTNSRFDTVGFLDPFRRPRFTRWANRWNVVLSDWFRTWAIRRRGIPRNDCLVRAGVFLVWFCCLGPDWWNFFRLEKRVLCLKFFKILPVYEVIFIACIASAIV